MPAVDGAEGIDDLRLLGERLCLDYANTVDPRHSSLRQEFLTVYEDLVAWATRAGTLDDDDARALAAEARRHPAEAAAALERGLALREAVYRTFSALAAGDAPDDDDLGLLADAHADALAHARLEPIGGSRYGWGWDPSGWLGRPLGPVVLDAVDLLRAGDRRRVRECPGPDGCGWLFYDTSRNRSRRWCSMSGCGNRAKGRRHYRRTHGGLRSGGTAPPP